MISEHSGGSEDSDDQARRRSELDAALRHTGDRIDRAARAAGRDPSAITLIVVTKFFPAADVELLRELGVRDIGESRDQEARDKLATVGERVRSAGGVRPVVHFVGQLQSNKARSVARYADVVHSVDRTRLVGSLDRAVANALEAGERERRLRVLIQIDLSTAGSDADQQAPRGGLRPGDRADRVDRLAERIQSAEHLDLAGVMAVAPRDAGVEATRSAFERLAGISAHLTSEHPDANWISAGMSGDLELAVASGATHLRVGSAILGSRPPAR